MSATWIIFCMACKLANGMNGRLRHSFGPSEVLLDLNWPPFLPTEDNVGHPKVDTLAAIEDTGMKHTPPSIGPMEMVPVYSDWVRSNQQQQTAVIQTENFQGKKQTSPRRFSPSDNLVSRNIPSGDQHTKYAQLISGFDLNENLSEQFLDTGDQDKHIPLTEKLSEREGALRIDGFDPGSERMENERLANASPSPKTFPFSSVIDSDVVSEKREVPPSFQLKDLNKQHENKSTSESKTESSCARRRSQRNRATAFPRARSHVAPGNEMKITFGRQATLTYYQYLRAKLSGCKGWSILEDTSTFPVQTGKPRSMERLTLLPNKEKRRRKFSREYSNYARVAHSLGSNEADEELGKKISDFIETLTFTENREEETSLRHDLYWRRHLWMRSCILMLLFDVKVVCVAFPEILKKDIHEYQLQAWSLFKLAWMQFFSGDIKNGNTLKTKLKGLNPKNIDEIIQHSAKQIALRSSSKVRHAATRTLLQIWLFSFSPDLYDLAKDSNRLVLKNQFINILNEFQKHPELS